jgi:hypothetical protein
MYKKINRHELSFVSITTPRSPSPSFLGERNISTAHCVTPPAASCRHCSAYCQANPQPSFEYSDSGGAGRGGTKMCLLSAEPMTCLLHRRDSFSIAKFDGCHPAVYCQCSAEYNYLYFGPFFGLSSGNNIKRGQKCALRL